MLISNKEILDSQILLVDDSELSVTLLFDMFTKAGYRNITSETDSRKVAKLYKELHPDLLVL
ncbi:MAG: two-component system response regulator, partial [Candidatus Omnitrophica bacterium]|nr:two-component system response regulator [Candidatus Omnitrophota bacterium]